MRKHVLIAVGLLAVAATLHAERKPESWLIPKHPVDKVRAARILAARPVQRLSSTQTCDVPLSPEGRAALYNWSLATGPELESLGVPPGFMATLGSRRFDPALGSVLKYRIVDNASTIFKQVDAAIAGINGESAPFMQYVKTAANDTSAVLTWKTGTGFEHPLAGWVNIPNPGCGGDFRFADGAIGNTLTSLTIYCTPNLTTRQKATPWLDRHEEDWHRFAFVHTSWPGCGSATPSAGPAYPADGNCVPGMAEAARWILQCPPGSFPQ